MFEGNPHNQAAAQQEVKKPDASAVAAMAEAWSGEINFAPAYSPLNSYAETLQENAASTFDPSDDYWGLPREPGFEAVAAYCSACHTLQIVMAQRQSREGWDYLLHWMVEKQGMAPPAPETRAEILEYLSAEFNR
jgi:hypothetical protein